MQLFHPRVRVFYPTRNNTNEQQDFWENVWFHVENESKILTLYKMWYDKNQVPVKEYVVAVYKSYNRVVVE